MEQNQMNNFYTGVYEPSAYTPVRTQRKMGCLAKVLIFIGGFTVLIFMIAFILAIVGDSGSTKTSGTQTGASLESVGEISKYIGQPLQFMEQELNVKTINMSEYKNFKNVHRVKQSDKLIFDCTVDEQNNIVKIVLYDSGKKGYKLCGVSTDTAPEDANVILENSGYIFVRENIWMTADEKDEIKYEEKKWIYEKNSSSLQDEILRSKAEANFTYQYDDSVGAVYIGNGQIVEYFHESYAEMFYQYEHHTDYQKEILNNTYNGRYVKISGKVTGVSENGMITVICTDEEATKAAGII